MTKTVAVFLPACRRRYICERTQGVLKSKFRGWPPTFLSPKMDACPMHSSKKHGAIKNSNEIWKCGIDQECFLPVTIGLQSGSDGVQCRHESSFISSLLPQKKTVTKQLWGPSGEGVGWTPVDYSGQTTLGGNWPHDVHLQPDLTPKDVSCLLLVSYMASNWIVVPQALLNSRKGNWLT